MSIKVASHGIKVGLQLGTFKIHNKIVVMKTFSISCITNHYK